jgi:hypothetical protein
MEELIVISSKEHIGDSLIFFFCYHSSGSAGPLVTYAYGVFHQENMELTAAYRDTAAESYKAEIRAVDFAEVRESTLTFSYRHWPLLWYLLLYRVFAILVS